MSHLAGKKPNMASAAFDSDDHDDFNPIKDLMPPTLSNGDIDHGIGKKRGRENDPLRRLIEESSADEQQAGHAAGDLTKRLKVS